MQPIPTAFHMFESDFGKPWVLVAVEIVLIELSIVEIISVVEKHAAWMRIHE